MAMLRWQTRVADGEIKEILKKYLLPDDDRLAYLVNIGACVIRDNADLALKVGAAIERRGVYVEIEP